MTVDQESSRPRGWLSFLAREGKQDEGEDGPSLWSLGVLNDRETIEVPGSVLLLASDHNEPLGLRNAPARTSHSSLPTGMPHIPTPSRPAEDPRKTTSDGKIILDPQPDDSANDPLNWAAWRRDSALLSLGLFCMVGGGMTPILAAGFTNVAHDYNVDVSKVSLTTGLYMMGMGLGSVIFSPTAILYGKRPVYLFGSVLFILASVWCALSPSFVSLILARIFQGIAVSPVECLPSATIAEIFFLHERAFRIGIYTLLLLGGKNLIPLVSAAVINRLGWRWVFWIVALVVGFCAALLFLFVPETFWDRTPIPRVRKSTRPGFFRRYSSRHDVPRVPLSEVNTAAGAVKPVETPGSPTSNHHTGNVHVAFAPGFEPADLPQDPDSSWPPQQDSHKHVVIAPQPPLSQHDDPISESTTAAEASESSNVTEAVKTKETAGESSAQSDSISPSLEQSGRTTRPNTPSAVETRAPKTLDSPRSALSRFDEQRRNRHDYFGDTDSEKHSISNSFLQGRGAYTHALRDLPAKSFVQQLKVFHGRLNKDKWHKVAIRPLILYSYPAVLWSAIVYSCSVGWLIVISESVALIYRNAESYNFNAFQTGLVYISPFIGGILGTAVAGKVSDIIVKAMARRNGGLYEPEFRLVMAIPVALTTVIGLMGFGWSAQIKDNWIVPTVFFGIVSFGCSLGSTTSITFCVDSYRQYAGEALVTLNFSKNIFHGLVFSLFVTQWIESDGPKTVFIWIGIIQLILLAFTVPMYIFGKRARMWTVRKNFMEKF